MSVIGVLIDGEATFHAPGVSVGGYDTLCAIDANDPHIGHQGLIEARPLQKITCQQCYRIWRDVIAMHLMNNRFVDEAKR